MNVFFVLKLQTLISLLENFDSNSQSANDLIGVVNSASLQRQLLKNLDFLNQLFDLSLRLPNVALAASTTLFRCHRNLVNDVDLLFNRMNDFLFPLNAVSQLVDGCYTSPLLFLD